MGVSKCRLQQLKHVLSEETGGQVQLFEVITRKILHTLRTSHNECYDMTYKYTNKAELSLVELRMKHISMMFEHILLHILKRQILTEVLSGMKKSHLNWSHYTADSLLTLQVCMRAQNLGLNI